MVSYVVALVAFVVFFADPIARRLSPSAGRMVRTPRPEMNESLLAIDRPNETMAGCPALPDYYDVHIFSREPLVLYIEGFLSPEERSHLLDIR